MKSATHTTPPKSSPRTQLHLLLHLHITLQEKQQTYQENETTIKVVHRKPSFWNIPSTRSHLISHTKHTIILAKFINISRHENLHMNMSDTHEKPMQFI